jgi:hypothetical protein
MEKRERKGKREEKMRERVCVCVYLCLYVASLKCFSHAKLKRHISIETETHIYRDRDTPI